MAATIAPPTAVFKDFSSFKPVMRIRGHEMCMAVCDPALASATSSRDIARRKAVAGGMPASECKRAGAPQSGHTVWMVDCAHPMVVSLAWSKADASLRVQSTNLCLTIDGGHISSPGRGYTYLHPCKTEYTELPTGACCSECASRMAFNGTLTLAECKSACDQRADCDYVEFQQFEGNKLLGRCGLKGSTRSSRASVSDTHYANAKDTELEVFQAQRDALRTLSSQRQTITDDESLSDQQRKDALDANSEASAKITATTTCAAGHATYQKTFPGFKAFRGGPDHQETAGLLQLARDAKNALAAAGCPDPSRLECAVLLRHHDEMDARHRSKRDTAFIKSPVGAPGSGSRCVSTGCLDKELLDKCKEINKNSKYRSGCNAFALGFSTGEPGGPLHASTPLARDYASCDPTECNALCNARYSKATAQDRARCESGCKNYRQLWDGAYDETRAHGCIWDDRYCHDHDGECAIKEEEVEAKCGAWDECAGVVCRSNSSGYCFARGAISNTVDSAAWVHKKTYLQPAAKAAGWPCGEGPQAGNAARFQIIDESRAALADVLGPTLSFSGDDTCADVADSVDASEAAPKAYPLSNRQLRSQSMRRVHSSKYCSLHQKAVLKAFVVSKPTYRAGQQGSNTCPAGTRPVPQAECEAANKELLPAGKSTNRSLQVGEWGHVPSGCSTRSKEGDNAAHFNKRPTSNAENDGHYTPLCVLIPGINPEATARDQCEAYCLLEPRCQACSIRFHANGQQWWNAIPECGTATPSTKADVNGAISLKRVTSFRRTGSAACDEWTLSSCSTASAAVTVISMDKGSIAGYKCDTLSAPPGDGASWPDAHRRRRPNMYSDYWGFLKGTGRRGVAVEDIRAYYSRDFTRASSNRAGAREAEGHALPFRPSSAGECRGAAPLLIRVP